MAQLSASDPLRKDLDAVSRLSAVPTILRVVAETTGLRFSAIARVTSDWWVACAVHDRLDFGLTAGGTLDVETTLCSKVRDTGTAVVIDHASEDAEYRTHRTPKLYGFESYVAVPIFLADGQYFGNICAFDPLPKAVNQPRILAMMKLFAELISLQLAAEATHDVTQAQLLDARQTAELREQFIAVLGHDLRNPLSSVIMGSDLLLRGSLLETQRRTLERIRDSGRRMSGLVSNLLDFVRARLGSGIGVALTDVDDLDRRLRHVVAEIESAHPHHPITLSCDLAGPVRCDPDRICQMISNLLANAVVHGAPARPVQVRALQLASGLQISVHNEGPPIPAPALASLFLPYSRSHRDPSQGLGLGLYIASQIAAAHGGTLRADSTVEAGVTFTFTLPSAT